MSTIHYNLNTLLDFIQSSNNDQPLQKHLLQLLLVHEGARKAYLLETGNDEFHISHLLILELFAKDLPLSITTDPLSNPQFPCYFIHKEPIDVPKNDEDIGKLLGMFRPGGDFGNYWKKRYYLEIYHQGTQMFAEILGVDSIDNEQFDIYYEEKKKMWNGVLEKYQLPFSFDFRVSVDDGRKFRHQKLLELDIDYITSHQEKYENDMFNSCKDEKELDNHLNLLEKWIKVRVITNKQHEKLLSIYQKK